jgi:hypothetical protein
MTTPTKRRRLTPAERLARLGERYLKLRDTGKAKYARSGDVLKKMISAGLMPGKPIVLPGMGPFVLVDNFEGEKTGGWATVPRFSLEPLSKKEAKKFEEAAQSA